MEKEKRKGGFLSGLLFEEEEIPVIPATPAVPVVPEVELGEVTGVLSIEEIYTKLGMEDMSQSIYKIKEAKDKLPAKMSDEMKKETLLATLSVVGLSVDNCIVDGCNRTAALDDVLAAYSEEANKIMSANEIQIAELTKQIEELKKANEERQKSLETQESTIIEEKKLIADTIKFIQPTA